MYRGKISKPIADGLLELRSRTEAARDLAFVGPLLWAALKVVLTLLFVAGATFYVRARWAEGATLA